MSVTKAEDVFAGLQGLLAVSQRLRFEYQLVGFNNNTRHIKWVDIQTNVIKSMDYVTFCCSEFTELILKCSKNRRQFLEPFPDFANLYSMITTDVKAYFVVMKNIIRLCL